MLWRSRTERDDAVRELRDENARLFAEVEAIQRRFSGIAVRMWRVQEDERRRLARDLHDQLGQVLTALVHRLEAPEGPDREACLEIARQALADVRELSRLLRPPVLDDLGLVAALRWLARRTQEAGEVEVSVSAPEDVPLAADAETLLFRIAQEAVTNAVKHAGASRIELRLDRVGDRVELRVRDDGRGFDVDVVLADPERGIGLASMADRLRLHGGELVIVSAPGRGTTITAGVHA